MPAITSEAFDAYMQHTHQTYLTYHTTKTTQVHHECANSEEAVESEEAIVDTDDVMNERNGWENDDMDDAYDDVC